MFGATKRARRVTRHVKSNDLTTLKREGNRSIRRAGKAILRAIDCEIDCEAAESRALNRIRRATERDIV